jgi:hypothetical protein
MKGKHDEAIQRTQKENCTKIMYKNPESNPQAKYGSFRGSLHP